MANSFDSNDAFLRLCIELKKHIDAGMFNGTVLSTSSQSSELADTDSEILEKSTRDTLEKTYWKIK